MMGLLFSAACLGANVGKCKMGCAIHTLGQALADCNSQHKVMVPPESRYVFRAVFTCCFPLKCAVFCFGLRPWASIQKKQQKTAKNSRKQRGISAETTYAARPTTYPLRDYCASKAGDGGDTLAT